MEGIWRELKTLRTSSSRIIACLSHSLPKVVLRRINQVALGQLQKFGPNCTLLSAYAICIESKSSEYDSIGSSEENSTTVSFLKQIVLDHDGDILDVSPSRIIACWIPGENTKHSVVARLAMQTAFKVSAAAGELVVSCVSFGTMNHAIAGGVCSQFVQFIYGELLQNLHSGNALARAQGRPFMFSRVVLSLNTELTSALSNVTVCEDFFSCNVPSEMSVSLFKAPLDDLQPDITGATLQWILNCTPFLSPHRKIVKQQASQSSSRLLSLCLRMNFDFLFTELKTDSEELFHSVSSFSRAQAAVLSVQRHCVTAQGELWRLVVNGSEAFAFIAFMLCEECDFVAIEYMISSITYDLDSMHIQCSTGVDLNHAQVLSYGPESRSNVFIQSPCILNSEIYAASSPWNHLKTGCPEVFPTSLHKSFQPAESNISNLFTHASPFEQKQMLTLHSPTFFDRQDAKKLFHHFLENIFKDPHQGVLVLCGHFGSGKSHLMDELQLSSDTKGVRSLRCCPEARSNPPLSPFISILSQLLNIDLPSATKESKLQKCRSFVRTQMLADDRDVALLGVIFDFTLENDFLEGLNVTEILQELKSVMSRAFHALGSLPDPYVLFIENVYLLDSYSWDLLMDLASKKVNIVCEALSAFDSDAFALEMKALLRRSDITKVLLGAVSLEVFEAFLCQKFKCERVKPEIVSYLHTQSSGRNLFANEWSDFMMMNGNITVIENELVFNGDYCLSINFVIPSSIQLLVETDFLRLDESKQLFLKIVAVLGRSFTLEDVCFLTRKPSSKPFLSSKRSSVQEAQDTYEICSCLCEIGIIRQDIEAHDLFTVTYVAPSLLTATGNTFDSVLHTQKAAGLSTDSVLFWCFQSHVVQSIVLNQLKDDQKKTISLKIASQCQYNSKALTFSAQETAKSSFRIAQHLFESGNSIDALSVIHTLSPSSIYNYLRQNVFLCFPPPVSYEVSEEAYIASRMFLVPWICSFCRCVESVNPYRMRALSPNLLHIGSNRVSASRSSSPSRAQSSFQDVQCKLKAETSSTSIKSTSGGLSRLTDPPKRLARFGDLAPAPTQQPMLSGASIWGEGEKAWRSQTLLHHPDPEPSAIYVLKNSKFTKKIPVIHSLRHISLALEKYKAGPGPRFDNLVKELTRHKIKVQARENQRQYKWQDDAISKLMRTTSIVGPQWSVASATAGHSPPASPLSKTRVASPDRPKTSFHGKTSRQSSPGTSKCVSSDGLPLSWTKPETDHL